MTLSRLAGLGLAAMSLAASFASALAAAPPRNQAAPASYRFCIGEFDATMISDGHLPLGKPGDGFPAAPAAEMS